MAALYGLLVLGNVQQGGDDAQYHTLHSIERLDIGPIVQCSKASERGPMRDGDMQRTSVSLKTRMEHHFLCRIICRHQSEVWILHVSSSDDPKRSRSLKS